MQTIGNPRILRRALNLKTGQLTSYGSGTGKDAGFYSNVGEDHRYEILTTGQYSGTTSIVLNLKTDVHSNECVKDWNTGLMWSRNPSASVGAASDGKLPWTTNGSGEGIFNYCDYANLVSLSGYSDWRIPFDVELQRLRKMEAPNAMPDSITFPNWIATNFWSSNTQPNVTTNAMQTSYLTGGNGGNIKTASFQVALVRKF